MELPLCTRGSLWEKSVWLDMKIKIKNPFILYETNQFAYDFAKDEGYICLTRHIDTRYHFISDQFKTKVFSWSMFKLSSACRSPDQANLRETISVSFGKGKSRNLCVDGSYKTWKLSGFSRVILMWPSRFQEKRMEMYYKQLFWGTQMKRTSLWLLRLVHLGLNSWMIDICKVLLERVYL